MKKISDQDRQVDLHGFDETHVEAAAVHAWATYLGLESPEAYQEKEFCCDDEERAEAEEGRRRQLSEWPYTQLYPDADDFRRCTVAVMRTLVALGWAPPAAKVSGVVHLVAPYERRGMRVTRCGQPTNRGPLIVVEDPAEVTCRMCRRCIAVDEGRNPGP